MELSHDRHSRHGSLEIYPSSSSIHRSNSNTTSTCASSISSIRSSLPSSSTTIRSTATRNNTTDLRENQERPHHPPHLHRRRTSSIDSSNESFSGVDENISRLANVTTSTSTASGAGGAVASLASLSHAVGQKLRSEASLTRLGEHESGVHLTPSSSSSSTISTITSSSTHQHNFAKPLPKYRTSGEPAPGGHMSSISSVGATKTTLSRRNSMDSDSLGIVGDTTAASSTPKSQYGLIILENDTPATFPTRQVNNGWGTGDHYEVDVTSNHHHHRKDSSRLTNETMEVRRASERLLENERIKAHSMSSESSLIAPLDAATEEELSSYTSQHNVHPHASPHQPMLDGTTKTSTSTCSPFTTLSRHPSSLDIDLALPCVTDPLSTLSSWVHQGKHLNSTALRPATRETRESTSSSGITLTPFRSATSDTKQRTEKMFHYAR